MRVALALVLAAGCGAARPARPTLVERTVAEQLDEIAYRGGAPASVAGVTLTRMGNGGVRAVRVRATDRGPVASAGESRIITGPAPPPRRPSAREDLRIEAAVRGALTTDPLLAGMYLDVDVDAGIVRLAGDLSSPEQAARALAIALDTPGVVAAESRCAWLSRTR